MNGGWGMSYEISLRLKPLDLTDDKSTLVQVMAWYRQATSHYLSQCWPRSMSPNGVTRPQWHSVKSPSMVDPQWNILYWGSKWNLHTVCWSAVGCEWGTTSVYFEITYVSFNPSGLPVFVVEPQYLLQYFFYFCQKYHLNYTYKIFKNVMLV